MNARPPTLSAVAFAPSPLMSAQITRLAPSLAKRSANARPIPLAAPVTTTILSLTCMRFVSRWAPSLAKAPSIETGRGMPEFRTIDAGEVRLRVAVEGAGRWC